MMDQLPEIAGLEERYGKSVHHGHYCDGWERLQIPCHSRRIRALQGSTVGPQSILFDDDSTVPFDALFFSSGQGQRSPLPKMLGCDCNEDDLIVTANKQCTNVAGV